MRLTVPSLAVMLALAACATQEAKPDPALAAPATGKPISCINTDQVVSRRPLGDKAILFEMLGGKRYRNDLPAACPSLSRADMETLVFEVHGSQYCRNDSFRVVDPMAMRSVGIKAFPICRLGEFTPIGKERQR